MHKTELLKVYKYGACGDGVSFATEISDFMGFKM